MRLFKINRRFEFPLPLTASLDLVRLKYTKLLNLFNLVTSSNSSSIHFTNKALRPHSTYKYEAFEVFKEGSVSIYSEGNKLKVDWSVKLDNLIYLSLIIAVIPFIIGLLFYQLKLITLLIICCSLLVLTFGIGFLYLYFKIDEINEICLEE